ncbi:MAG: hypothetical protein IPH84_14945 [Bacteroidales bacterium]|nr:hypothetical protein [Bacteroidales bacterium]
MLIAFLLFYQPENPFSNSQNAIVSGTIKEKVTTNDKVTLSQSSETQKVSDINTQIPVSQMSEGDRFSHNSSPAVFASVESSEPVQRTGFMKLLQSRTKIHLSERNRYAPLYEKNQKLHHSLMAVQPNNSNSYPIPEPFENDEKKGKNFTLAANYLPESLENGNGTSMFHNFGLMASLGNEKTRIQSSLGMAYNTEHRVYDVNYTQFIPITVPNPGQPSDSTAIMETTGATELEGTERHQYLTYDLGLGKRLFSVGKMTTWVNTGAGIAFKLDDASLRETTIKTINQHNNSQVNKIDLEIPDYNGVNINIMASLDFNYKIMDRLSISFAPTSRIYLKPVLLKEGSSTDSFSLGFRSGMKFEF